MSIHFNSFYFKLNHKLIDYYITENSPWRFVRTRVLGFEPGNPKGCPHNVFPEPPDNTELVLETETSVPFGEYGIYKCSNESRTVTNDGLTYKLKCLRNGRLQNRKWLQCRERGMCTKRPVIPPPSSNMNLSESRNVLEFDYANYTCSDPSHVLSPPTEDNIFRVLCKRKDRRGRNNFEQSVRVQWPTCVGKPESACDIWSLPEHNLNEAPTGYKLKEDKVSYVLHGSKVEFICEQEGFLAGNVSSIFYECNNKTFNLLGFQAAPTCRQPAECSMDIPVPLEESGLKGPQLLKPLKESETADYTCTQSGWKLFGDYREEKDFVGFNSSLSPPSLNIVDGVLKLMCKEMGDNTASIETISAWPKCRNEAIKQCEVSSIETQVGRMWPLTNLNYTSTSPVNVGDYATIKCKDPSEINENFKERKLKCIYDGTFEINEEFKACRTPKNCNSTIVPDGSKPWEDKGLTLNSTEQQMNEIKQFDIVEFVCSNDKTIKGLKTTTEMSPGSIENGVFKLPCDLDEMSNWKLPTTWPE